MHMKLNNSAIFWFLFCFCFVVDDDGEILRFRWKVVAIFDTLGYKWCSIFYWIMCNKVLFGVVHAIFSTISCIIQRTMFYAGLGKNCPFSPYFVFDFFETYVFFCIPILLMILLNPSIQLYVNSEHLWTFYICSSDIRNYASMWLIV